MHKLLVVIVIAGVIVGETTLDGRVVFEKRCGGCHSLARDKEGPRLGGVYGRVAGSLESYEYSEALKRSGIKWDDATLEQWLIDTEKLVPGNNMAFRVLSAEERRAIVAFLRAGER